MALGREIDELRDEIKNEPEKSLLGTLRAVNLLGSALEISINNGAGEDWRCLPGQLVARLIGYADDKQGKKVVPIAALV